MRTSLHLNILIPLLLLIFVSASGQPRSHRSFHRWFAVQGDSIQVEYVLPAGEEHPPLIVMLPDRFGIHTSMHSIMSFLADQGFGVFAIPLRSANVQGMGGIPAVTVDSADANIVAQISIDIANLPGGNGRLGLLAFDIGASIGATVMSRYPIFTAAALFYPDDFDALFRTLPHISKPVSLQIPAYLPGFEMARIADLKESVADKNAQVFVNIYKDTHPFFLNSRHEFYNKKSTGLALGEMLKFFRTAL